MKRELKLKTIELRKEGYSINELRNMVGASKGTISLWVKNVSLSPKAAERLRSQSTNGRLASQKTIREKTKQKNIVANQFANNILSQIKLDKNYQMLLCSMIYLCEGNKIPSGITFTNSDPQLVRSFLFLFRNSFNLDEKRFRILMHLHSYHDEKEQKAFWSKITNVPENQFNKSYLKPSNGRYKKEGYQGCIKVGYYDTSLIRKMQSIAKMFMERYK